MNADRSGEIVPVRNRKDVLPAYQGTPIEELLCCHNLCAHPRYFTRPQLFIATCMDNRVSLRVPARFAFVMRVPGANLREREFGLSCAVALFGIHAVCLVGHDDCAVENVSDSRQAFVSGLVENAGWQEEDATRHFDRSHASYRIGDAIAFLRGETKRLQSLYPKVTCAALLYKVGEDRLYQVPPEPDPLGSKKPQEEPS